MQIYQVFYIVIGCDLRLLLWFALTTAKQVVFLVLEVTTTEVKINFQVIIVFTDSVIRNISDV